MSLITEVVLAVNIYKMNMF